MRISSTFVFQENISVGLFAIVRLSLELLSQFNEGGNVAEWLARRTCNPAVPGSSPALATCWICS